MSEKSFESCPNAQRRESTKTEYNARSMAHSGQRDCGMLESFQWTRASCSLISAWLFGLGFFIGISRSLFAALLAFEPFPR